MCRPGSDPHLAADSVSVVVTDLSLVIGLSVAIIVFLCVTSVAVRVIRSKRTSHSVYNMADMCKCCVRPRSFTMSLQTMVLFTRAMILCLTLISRVKHFLQHSADSSL